MKQEIKLVAFDLGNVMVDVQEHIPASKLARLSGQPEDRVFEEVFSPEKKAGFESGKVSWADHASAAIRSLGIPVSEPELRRIYHESLIPDEAVLGIVSEVAEKMQITIASNTSEPHWEWAQENLPFASRFDPPILSYQVGAMKPDAEFYEALIERSGFEPSEIFFTDDRPENIDGARSLGITAFLFTGPDQLVRDLLSCGIAVSG